MKFKIVLYQSPKSKLWHFRIVSRNGKIVGPSEGYKRVGGAIKTLRSLFGQYVSLLKQTDALAVKHGITTHRPWDDVRG